MNYLLPNGNMLNNMGQEIMPNGYNLGYNTIYAPPVPVQPRFVEPLPRLLDNGNLLNPMGQEIMPNGYNLGYRGW